MGQAPLRGRRECRGKDGAICPAPALLGIASSPRSQVVFAGASIWWGRGKANQLKQKLKKKKGWHRMLGHVATVFIKAHALDHVQVALPGQLSCSHP